MRTHNLWACAYACAIMAHALFNARLMLPVVREQTALFMHNHGMVQGLHNTMDMSSCNIVSSRYSRYMCVYTIELQSIALSAPRRPSRAHARAPADSGASPRVGVRYGTPPTRTADSLARLCAQNPGPWRRAEPVHVPVWGRAGP